MFGQYEVVTYGGGANYRDIFIGVAAMCGTDAISSLIRLAMLLGLVLVLFRGMVDLNAGRGLKWFIMCAVIYGVVMVPKVTVHITDKFDPTLAGADVANVPLGIAFAESLASQIGSRAISISEAAFGTTSVVSFGATGIDYGANYMAAVSKTTFTDQLYKQNFNTFIDDCILYEIKDNNYTIDDLSKATNIMQFVTVTKPPNPARSMVWVNTAGTAAEIIDCPTAGTRLSTALTDQGANAALMLSRSLEPDRTFTDALRISRSRAQGDQMATLLGFASASGQQMIEQAAVANQIKAAVAGGDTSAGAALANAQAQIQTFNTQSLLGPVGAKAIILLKIVVECLFIGMFGIMFPLFLLPQIGVKLLQGYFIGFFYLQLWGPMYVVINKIISTAAVAQTAGAANVPGASVGLTLQTVGNVNDINTMIQGVASGMILMVPVLAAALTKGAMAVGSQGEALLQPFRSGAESAAQSQTTGNYSYGNTSYDTHAFHNVQGNKTDTSRWSDVGRTGSVSAAGDSVWNNVDGSRSVRAAPSDTAISAEGLKSWSANRREAASVATERAATFDKVLSDSQSIARQQIHDYARASSVGTDTRSGMENASRDSQSSAASWFGSMSQSASSRFGLSKDQVADLVSKVSVSESDRIGLNSGVSAGGGPNGLPVKVGGSISTDRGYQTSDTSSRGLNTRQTQAADWVRSQLQTAEGRKAMERVETESLNTAWGRTASTSASTRDVASRTWSSTQQFAESRKTSQNESERLSREADRAETVSQTVRGSRSAEFARFAMGDGQDDGYLRFDPEQNHSRSDAEIANILQGRTAQDQARLGSAVDVFMQRYPAPEPGRLFGEVQNDVKAPAVLGVDQDLAGSFAGGGQRTSGGAGSVEGKAKARIAEARSSVKAPSFDREISSPAAGTGELSNDVDRALERGRQLSKPKPWIVKKD